MMIAFHLHKKCFSIRLVSTRKVVGYTDRIVVRNVSFPISASGRMRVLRERRKNVHAFVRGNYEKDLQYNDGHGFREAYYNPYEVAAFVDRETLEPIGAADVVLCERGQVYYWRVDIDG
ncbi:hypothetical protein [Paenibacillus paeoniae]|uniref:hypothetical protein n=1 Tax=Paenibacillus paeoniae TaxID=2292705 RepID=UPI001058E8A9|nr:hypothetical protein [Paenibacillus paeoniae]